MVAQQYRAQFTMPMHGQPVFEVGALQIAAQNGVHFSFQSSADTEASAAQMMPTVSYPADPGDKGKEKAGECRFWTVSIHHHI